MTLKGQTAIVTGGAVGLGRAFAADLARAGAEVTICDIREDVRQAAASLSTGGTSVEGVLADVSQPADVQRVVDGVISRSGRIDILINNAGVLRLTDARDPLDKSIDDFDYQIRTNLKGVFLFGRAVAPQMVKQGGGHIVNIATDHMHNCGWPDQVSHADAPGCLFANERRRPGWHGMDVYDASKWALNGLTHAWALTLREHGVRVNNLCMGAAESPMMRATWAALTGVDDETLSGPEHEETIAAWLKPGDVSRVLMELLEEGPDGRSGDNVGVWVGHPATLPPPSQILNVPPSKDDGA